MDKNQYRCSSESRTTDRWTGSCEVFFFFFVEAETALWGIEVAESIRRNSAIMETDSQKVANL